MAKQISSVVKLQVPAGQANPAPPVGSALGQHGVNPMEFCKAFNAKTQDQMGLIIPVVITVYADRSFSFITKTPPAAVLLKREAGLAKASGEPNRQKVGIANKCKMHLNSGAKGETIFESVYRPHAFLAVPHQTLKQLRTQVT